MWTLEGDYIGDDYGLLKICVGDPIVIDKLGFYKCRNGFEAEVTETSLGGDFPVRGTKRYTGFFSWTRCGRFLLGSPHELDLVEYIGPVREGTK